MQSNTCKQALSLIFVSSEENKQEQQQRQQKKKKKTNKKEKEKKRGKEWKHEHKPDLEKSRHICTVKVRSTGDSTFKLIQQQRNVQKRKNIFIYIQQL